VPHTRNLHPITFRDLSRHTLTIKLEYHSTPSEITNLEKENEKLREDLAIKNTSLKKQSAKIDEYQRYIKAIESQLSLTENKRKETLVQLKREKKRVKEMRQTEHDNQQRQQLIMEMEMRNHHYNQCSIL
jgi:septal ring factor EnvC (AmiA/AmiB activator)